jgi:hypothetical protein
MQNPFASPAYNLASMTAAINRIPNMYGRVRELGLFTPEGVTQRTIIVEEMNGVLTLLPTMPVGSPGTLGKAGKRKVRSFVIPHIPHDDVVLPEEVQGIRGFGMEDGPDPIALIMARKLAAMRAKHAITLEHLRIGALKGIILDADASTLYNLYTEFEIVQKTVDFVLGTGTTNIQAKCREVTRHIEDNLKGEVMNSVRCLVSQEFWDKFIAHAEVKEAYKYFQANGRNPLREDVKDGFFFQGIVFEEYRGVATDKDGNSRRFIAANDGHAFPVGTVETFRTHFAPADFNETVNTIGQELYAKQEERKFGRGIDLHSQSNPLPICRRPDVLVRVFSSN